MATISERLAYVLTFDTSSGVKSLEKFGSTADKELGKADGKLDKLGVNMTKFGAGAMAFAGVAGVGLFKLASGAADAQANMSALEQVVGETVAQDVGRWAEDSARGVGLASKDAVGAATSFAQLGKIIGLGGQDLSKFSTDLVTLSADFAAFKNVSPDQALQDIQAGFAGSTEVMRKYGIFLDDATLKAAYFRETGEKVSGTLTAQQKIVAINSELYRQGGDMLGQWGRESGELAGQQAILKAELTNLGDRIGAGVLPMMVSLMGAATQVATAFGSINDATAGMVGKVAGITVAVAALGGGLLFVTGKIIKFREHLTDISTKVSPRMAAAMGVAGVAILGLGLYAKDAADDARELTAAIGELSRASDDEILDNFNKALLQSVVEGNGVNKMLDELVRTQLGAAERIVATAKAKGQETEITKLLEAAIAGEKEARDNAATSAEVEAAAVGESTDATEEDTTAKDANAEAVKANAEAIRDLVAAREEEIDAALNAGNASLAYRQQQADTAATVRDATAAQRDATLTDDERAQAARDVEAAVYAQAEAAVANAEDQAAANGQTLTAYERTAIYKSELETLAGYLDGPARAAIDAHIASLRRIPASIATDIEVRARVGYRGSSIPEFHSGGVVGVGNFASDEVPAVLQKGEMVLTEGQQAAVSSAMAGGGGGSTVININMPPGSDGDDVVRAIRQHVRKNGPIQGIT